MQFAMAYGSYIRWGWGRVGMRTLRGCYWVGAICDGAWFVPTLRLGPCSYAYGAWLLLSGCNLRWRMVRTYDEVGTVLVCVRYVVTWIRVDFSYYVCTGICWVTAHVLKELVVYLFVNAPSEVHTHRIPLRHVHDCTGCTRLGMIMVVTMLWEVPFIFYIKNERVLIGSLQCLLSSHPS